MRCTFIIAIAVLLGFGLTACDRDEDESDLQSSIRLLAPNGGETLIAGTTFTIRWSTYYVLSPWAFITLSTDGGEHFDHLISSEGHGGTYLWSVPYLPSDRCKVRVETAVVMGVRVDTSDSCFTIVR